jgi:hypothetical protein
MMSFQVAGFARIPGPKLKQSASTVPSGRYENVLREIPTEESLQSAEPSAGLVEGQALVCHEQTCAFASGAHVAVLHY